MHRAQINCWTVNLQTVPYLLQECTCCAWCSVTAKTARHKPQILESLRRRPLDSTMYNNTKQWQHCQKHAEREWASPPLDNIWVMVIVWRLRGNVIRTALQFICARFNLTNTSCTNALQWQHCQKHAEREWQHTVWHLDNMLTSPSLCVNLLLLVYCRQTYLLCSTRQHLSYDDCLEVKREYYQNSSVLDYVTQCSQSAAHLCE